MIDNHKHNKEMVQDFIKILRDIVPVDEIHKLELKGTEYFIQGEYDKSIEIQNKIIQLEPDNGTAWENKTSLIFRKNGVNEMETEKIMKASKTLRHGVFIKEGRAFNNKSIYNKGHVMVKYRYIPKTFWFKNGF